MNRFFLLRGPHLNLETPENGSYSNSAAYIYVVVSKPWPSQAYAFVKSSFSLQFLEWTSCLSSNPSPPPKGAFTWPWFYLNLGYDFTSAFWFYIANPEEKRRRTTTTTTTTDKHKFHVPKQAFFRGENGTHLLFRRKCGLKSRKIVCRKGRTNPKLEQKEKHQKQQKQGQLTQNRTIMANLILSSSFAFSSSCSFCFFVFLFFLVCLASCLSCSRFSSCLSSSPSSSRLP